MISIRSTLAIAGAILLVSNNSYAKLDDFKDGTVIKGFGKYAPVATASVDKHTKMKVAFDVGAPADAGQLNRRFDSLARFINMQVASGVPKENIQLALVVHGKASFDLLDKPSYQKLYKQDNPNIPLLQALMENGVRVILCGQTGAAYDITLSQLVKGSEVALSAMTAHALLQQDGYTVNPF
jgi:intracellular sulfur oxidation DsrE/DsrF family protein